MVSWRHLLLVSSLTTKHLVSARKGIDLSLSDNELSLDSFRWSTSLESDAFAFTSYPTITPSTSEPTFSPTKYPSRSPTAVPSFAPSKQSSSSPSASSTEGPTAVPSLWPSGTYSTGPSASPSEQHSLSPSFSSSPSDMSSLFPSTSVQPSLRPTSSPSVIPTETDSMSPSGSPSEGLSSSPTGQAEAINRNGGCPSGENLFQLILYDQWGDGWDGTHLAVSPTDQPMQYVFKGGMQSGKVGFEFICLKLEKCYQIIVGGGAWANEIGWEIRRVQLGVGYTGDGIATGTAPFQCTFSIGENMTALDSADCTFTCNGSIDVFSKFITNPPTKTPSLSPSLHPTTSLEPTSIPSTPPSTSPTNEPSRAMSSVPSSEPSTSRVPSEMPSDTPSASAFPSLAPSLTPSVSGEPSMAPVLVFEPNAEPSNANQAYYNYNPDSNRGPDKWKNVKLGNPNYWLEFNGKLEGDGANQNVCGKTAIQQSPIDVVPFGNAACNEHHQIRTRDGNWDIDDAEVTAQIHPNKLRLLYDRSNGRPWSDFPDGWGGEAGAIHIDVKMKSEHWIHGKQFDGELQIFHFHKRKRRTPAISIMIDGSKGNPKNVHFQKALDKWQAIFDADTLECENERRKERRNIGLAESLLGGKGGEGISTWADEPVEEEIAFQKRRQQAQDIRVLQKKRWSPYHESILRTVHFFGYKGTLTEPPCGEWVSWRIMDVPMLVSDTQLEQIQRLIFDHVHIDADCLGTSVHFEESVARPIQPKKVPVWRCTRQNFVSDIEMEKCGKKGCNQPLPPFNVPSEFP